MGFPMPYSELLFPKLLLQMVFLLSFVRRLISSSFTFFGLGDLLDSETPWPDNPILTSTTTTTTTTIHHNTKPQQFQSISALLLQEILPVVKFKNLRHSAAIADDSCAVCLHEFEEDDSMRRLTNCRHVFHMCCLDRWMEHDQSTCPLCRTPLIPEEMRGVLCDRMWAAAVGLPDEYVDDDDDDHDDEFCELN